MTPTPTPESQQVFAPGTFASAVALVTGGGSGIGLVLGGGATLTDVALERGWRGGDGAGLEESFWRVILSVTVLGR